MKRTDLDYDATLLCCSKCLAVIFLQTTEKVSELGIWKQTMQKELTAPGFITGIGWKMRRLRMLEENWQGETRNRRLGKLRLCSQGKMLYPDARLRFKVSEHLWWEGSQVLQPLLIVLFLPPTISFFLGLILLITFFFFFFTLRAWCKVQQNQWKILCWLSWSVV